MIASADMDIIAVPVIQRRESQARQTGMAAAEWRGSAELPAAEAYFRHLQFFEKNKNI
jgi:hypothetical protein